MNWQPKNCSHSQQTSCVNTESSSHLCVLVEENKTDFTKDFRSTASSDLATPREAEVQLLVGVGSRSGHSTTCPRI